MSNISRYRGIVLVLIFILERALEIILVAFLMAEALGPYFKTDPVSIWLEMRRYAIIPIYGYGITLILPSFIWFGLFRRRNSALGQSVLMSAVFLVHFMGFSIIFVGLSNFASIHGAQLLIIGGASVFISSLVGSGILLKIR